MDMDRVFIAKRYQCLNRSTWSIIHRHSASIERDHNRNAHDREKSHIPNPRMVKIYRVFVESNPLIPGKMFRVMRICVLQYTNHGLIGWYPDLLLFLYEVRRQFSLWTLPCIHMQIWKQNCTENIRKWFATPFIVCVTFISSYSPTNLLYYWLTRVSRTIWANTSNCIKHIAVKMIYLGTSVHISFLHFMWLSIFAMPNPPLWAHLIIFRIFHLTAWCLLCFPLNLSIEIVISVS